MPAYPRALWLLGLCVLLCSCKESKPAGWKETFPVKGEVYVDGKPASGLQVTCTDASATDTKTPAAPPALTTEDGKFELSSYKAGDGVPVGDYALTFIWGKINLMSMSYSGPDKLNGRYTDPKQSKNRFKVEKGKPTDLGRIELTTK